MAKPDLEQNLGQEPPSQRARRITLRGVGLDPETGVWKFAGEAGGPPESVELSGDQPETYERREAALMNELYDSFRNTGKSEAEARRLAGID